MVTSSQLTFICTWSIFNSFSLKFYPSALAESIIFVLKYNFKDEKCLEHWVTISGAVKLTAVNEERTQAANMNEE